MVLTLIKFRIFYCDRRPGEKVQNAQLLSVLRIRLHQVFRSSYHFSLLFICIKDMNEVLRYLSSWCQRCALLTVRETIAQTNDELLWPYIEQACSSLGMLSTNRLLTVLLVWGAFCSGKSEWLHEKILLIGIPVYITISSSMTM